MCKKVVIYLLVLLNKLFYLKQHRPEYLINETTSKYSVTCHKQFISILMKSYVTKAKLKYIWKKIVKSFIIYEIEILYCKQTSFSLTGKNRQVKI